MGLWDWVIVVVVVGVSPPLSSSSMMSIKNRSFCCWRNEKIRGFSKSTSGLEAVGWIDDEGSGDSRRAMTAAPTHATVTRRSHGSVNDRHSDDEVTVDLRAPAAAAAAAATTIFVCVFLAAEGGCVGFS